MAIVAVVLVALRSPSPAKPDATIDVSAPPNAARLAAPCAQLLSVLPVQLDKLDQRVVRVKPEIASVVAWGEPAIVLRCGVDRPTDFRADSKLQSGGVAPGPFYDITQDGDNSVWTAVDRAPWISISIPTKYVPANSIPVLSRLIQKALPAVCAVEDAADPDTLCTRRQ